MKLTIENPTFTLTLNFKQKKESLEFLENYRSRTQQKVTVQAYAKNLAESLRRRGEACVRRLLENVDNICYADDWHVEWSRGQFNLPSYEAIQRGIEQLEKEDYESFLNDGPVLDQTIKAIMNDVIALPERIDNVRRSELVSLLTNSMISDIQARTNP